MYGIALSGGSIRGTAHIGVLKAMEERGIKPKFIAGTSAGAIVAAFYATGHSPKQLEKMALELSWEMFDLNFKEMILDATATAWRVITRQKLKTPTTSGLIRGRKLEAFLSSFLGQVRLKGLPIPFAATAVDINRAKTVVFTNKPFQSKTYEMITDARVIDALRASMAIPVVFTPKVFGSRQLVDGGLTANLPTDIVYAMGADRVISVNLGYTGELVQEVTNFLEIAIQSIDVMAHQITKLRHGDDKLTIEPRIYDVSAFDFTQIKACIDRGYAATHEFLSNAPI